ncbi:allantoin permease [Phocicoccus pinnipedialis]|uniref:Allantoin permease n=1 Tax=Phocicoccus pinnipedialis TaxID=110845 RepID=A0A6V7RFJ6_9BACL|nr:cytosine permease [Jeotgalicoccus pinnipedialis]MBP1939159.1 allantoin permease [Jeotgalicoccus pinnipedialis]CAD2076530.1 Putative allantoin permease [Jeotgalicoccus pinnipedialis]
MDNTQIEHDLKDPKFYENRGYNKDIMPKNESQRDSSVFNFFTLWMGSVHNIPNYVMVGTFLMIGLTPLQVMIAVLLSSFIIAALLTVNGVAGSKYGIPFAMHLRHTYGDIGAKLPGILRGVVAGIAWFGVQTYFGAIAMMIILKKVFPSFTEIGGGREFLGITIPIFIAFMIFWAVNFLIGFGGGSVLNKFTAILNPLIYVVFGGMMIWGIKAAGGFGEILAYQVPTTSGKTYPAIIGFLVVFSSFLSVWAAPGASVADFTQNSKNTKTQIIGQFSGLFVAHLLFAVSSVAILVGGAISLGITSFDILDIIEKFDSDWAIYFAIFVLLMTTISTNATGNIIPAGYQLSALMPKLLTYRGGVIVASVASVLIMPWKLVQGEGGIMVFLGLIGSILGPVAGVMIVHFYKVAKQKINIEKLYFDQNKPETAAVRINGPAYIATIAGLIITLLGNLPGFEFIRDTAWFVGFISAAAIYYVLTLNKGEKFLF